MNNNENILNTLIEDVSCKIMQRFDNLEQILKTLAPKSLKTMKIIDGEMVYDNQDLCEMFNKSKRTLQRYRSQGELIYTVEKGTTYYKESDVNRFKLKMAEEFEQKKQQRDAEKTILNNH